MYNYIADYSYKDGFDYLLTFNDDAIILTYNWTKKMIESLKNNKMISNLGSTGFIPINLV